MDLKVLHQLSYGLYILGAPKEGGGFAGCVVNTVFQVTSEEPMVAVSVNKDNYTCSQMEKAGRFTVSILSEETPAEVIGRFGFFTSRDKDKFGETDHELLDGLPYIKENCAGYLTCEVAGVYELSTHKVFFSKVLDARAGVSAEPMTYSYYHRVIKGKAPKNAPTYQPPEDKGGKTAFVCDVCGYVAEIDGDELPEDFRCPVCGVDRSHFKKRG